MYACMHVLVVHGHAILINVWNIVQCGHVLSLFITIIIVNIIFCGWFRLLRGDLKDISARRGHVPVGEGSMHGLLRLVSHLNSKYLNIIFSNEITMLLFYKAHDDLIALNCRINMYIRMYVNIMYNWVIVDYSVSLYFIIFMGKMTYNCMLPYNLYYWTR